MFKFEPIDNQRLAQLVGVNYDQEDFIPGRLVYSRTHIAAKRLHLLKNFGPCVLLTSFSDGSVTDEMVERLPSNVRMWFSNNVMSHLSRVRAVPIGIRYSWEGERLLMIQREQGRLPERNLCYMNFLRNVPRNPNPREGIYELLGDKSWMTVQGGFDHVPMQEFYGQMASHPFTLSPPGAGPDCHRHWEALALGSIPIVLNHRATDLMAAMPCLRVNHWGEVTEELLKESLPELQERFSWTYMREMSMGYWRNEILTEVNLL